MSGAETLGEEVVPGVRVVRLSGPVRVAITPAPARPSDPAVDAEWDRKRAINPRLFDDRVLSVKAIDPASGVIRCEMESYKRLVVQPEVETGVRQLSVTGVLTAQDGAGVRRVLLGRRSHKTRMYGGMWQNCPAGGVDPRPDAAALSPEDIASELLREVKEESGLTPRHIAHPIAIIYDQTARSHDLIVPVDMGHLNDLSTTRGWEYDELRWMDRNDFQAIEPSAMAITRAIFRMLSL